VLFELQAGGSLGIRCPMRRFVRQVSLMLLHRYS